MNVSKDIRGVIEELQVVEQHIQSFLAQKQAIQVELQEVLNALGEIAETKEDIYRILSGIMLKTDKESLKKELEERKKLMELRINSIEKQEKILEDRANRLKEKITDDKHKNSE